MSDPKWKTAKSMCPSCGNDSFPSLAKRDPDAIGDGPWWCESQPHHTCECGAVLRIEADGETAFAVEVEES